MTPEDIANLPYRRCAGVVLMNAAGLVFAGRRNDTGGAAWQMPQGGIDAGEDAETAALRELEEETGVPRTAVQVVAETPGWIAYDLPVEVVPKVWKGRYRGQEQKWVLLRFLGTDDQIDIATEHPEFDQWRWMSAGDLLDVIVPFKRGVYAQVFDAFSDHLA